jgi:hypothetical protein
LIPFFTCCKVEYQKDIGRGRKRVDDGKTKKKEEEEEKKKKAESGLSPVTSCNTTLESRGPLLLYK